MQSDLYFFFKVLGIFCTNDNFRKMQREETNDRTQEFSDSFEIVENPLKPDIKMAHYEQLYWKEMHTIGKCLGVKGLKNGLTHF